MKTKEFMKKHKNEFIIIGGVIVGLGALVFLGYKANKIAAEHAKEAANIIKALSEVDVLQDFNIDEAITFMKNADDTLKYGVFKEGPTFNIIIL